MCYNISQRHELGAYYEIYFKSTQFAEGGGGGVRGGGVLTLASLANLMQLTSNIDAHGN